MRRWGICFRASRAGTVRISCVVAVPGPPTTKRAELYLSRSARVSWIPRDAQSSACDISRAHTCVEAPLSLTRYGACSSSALRSRRQFVQCCGPCAEGDSGESWYTCRPCSAFGSHLAKRQSWSSGFVWGGLPWTTHFGCRRGVSSAIAKAVPRALEDSCSPRSDGLCGIELHPHRYVVGRIFARSWLGVNVRQAATCRE